MTVLRVIFANKDPLIALHMLYGGGEAISYKTLLDFAEYLEVWEAIQEQQRLEIEQKAQNQGQK